MKSKLWYKNRMKRYMWTSTTLCYMKLARWNTTLCCWSHLDKFIEHGQWRRSASKVTCHQQWPEFDPQNHTVERNNSCIDRQAGRFLKIRSTMKTHRRLKNSTPPYEGGGPREEGTKQGKQNRHSRKGLCGGRQGKCHRPWTDEATFWHQNAQNIAILI